MISRNSTYAIEHSYAMSAGASGVSWNLPVTFRPMLANSRKEHGVRTAGIVIG